MPTKHFEICKVCKNRQFSPATGLFCGLSNAKPEFVDSCPSFEQDPLVAALEAGAAHHASGGGTGSVEDAGKPKNIVVGIVRIITGLAVMGAGGFRIAMGGDMAILGGIGIIVGLFLAGKGIAELTRKR